MRLNDVKKSGNIQDRTGMSLLEAMVRDKTNFTDEEKSLMKKNGWTAEDMIVLRSMKKVIVGDRWPDKNSQDGGNWYYPDMPEYKGN